MRIFCPAMPSYLFSYRFAAGPRTRACRNRCWRENSRGTDVLSKDLGHIARPIRDGTHGPPQIRWGNRAIVSEFHPQAQSLGSVLACETTDRVASALVEPQMTGRPSPRNYRTPHSGVSQQGIGHKAPTRPTPLRANTKNHGSAVALSFALPQKRTDGEQHPRDSDDPSTRSAENSEKPRLLEEAGPSMPLDQQRIKSE